MTTNKDMIDALVTDAAAQKRAARPDRMALVWLLCSMVYVVGAALILGPFRPGFAEQLQHSPRFLLEMLLGLAAILLCGFALFRSAVPAALGPMLRRAAVVCACLWVANYGFALFSPALEPSMLGKRGHCALETLIYALPPLLAALYVQRRWYPLNPRESALFAGLAAGLMPAWLMQVACMYEPVHILTLHILPGLGVALAAVLLVMMFPVQRPAPG